MSKITAQRKFKKLDAFTTWARQYCNQAEFISEGRKTIKQKGFTIVCTMDVGPQAPPETPPIMLPRQV